MIDLQRIARLNFVRCVALGVAIAMALGASASAQSIGHSSKITLDSPTYWFGVPGRGFGRYECNIGNHGEHERVVTVEIELLYWSAESSQEKSFVLAPGEQRDVSFTVPAFGINSQGLEVSLEDDSGARFTTTIGSLIDDNGSGASSGLRVLCISDATVNAGWAANRASELSAAAAARPSVSETHIPGTALGPVASYPGGPIPAAVSDYLVARLTPRDTPADADALQGFDVVIFESGGSAPSTELERALARYARRGGTLVLTGAKLGPLQSLADPLSTIDTSGTTVTHRIGFGYVIRDTQPPLDTPAQVEAIVSCTVGRPATIPDSLAGLGPNRAWRVPIAELDDVRAPDPRLMCLLILGLALVLGPLNLWFVKRSGRNVLLLVSVPVSALVLTLGVAAYGLLRDGVGLIYEVTQWSWIDQRAGQLTTLEGRCYFAGPLVRGGLRPAEGTLVAPLPASEHRGRSRKLYAIDDTDGLKLSADFLPIRRSNSLYVASDRTTRLGLEVDWSGTQPRVANALGTAIEELDLRDFNGQFWTLDSQLAAGGTAELAPVTGVPRRGDARDASTFGELLKGSYIALLESPIGLDQLQQTNADLVDSTAIAYGVLEHEQGAENGR